MSSMRSKTSSHSACSAASSCSRGNCPGDRTGRPQLGHCLLAVARQHAVSEAAHLEEVLVQEDHHRHPSAPEDADFVAERRVRVTVQDPQGDGGLAGLRDLPDHRALSDAVATPDAAHHEHVQLSAISPQSPPAGRR
jgi:hypothetical protein